VRPATEHSGDRPQGAAGSQLGDPIATAALW